MVTPREYIEEIKNRYIRSDKEFVLYRFWLEMRLIPNPDHPHSLPSQGQAAPSHQGGRDFSKFSDQYHFKLK